MFVLRRGDEERIGLGRSARFESQQEDPRFYLTDSTGICILLIITITEGVQR